MSENLTALPTRTVNRITRRQERLLEDWLGAPATMAWINETRPVREMIARRATRELGFNVTTGNIAGAAQVAGVAIPSPKRNMLGRRARGALSPVDALTIVRAVTILATSYEIRLPGDFAALHDRLEQQAAAIAAAVDKVPGLVGANAIG